MTVSTDPVAAFIPGGGVMITLPEIIEDQEEAEDERPES